MTGEGWDFDRRRPVNLASPERLGVAQVAALLATGAAAASLAAGLGTYLFIRFTQHRGKGPHAGPSPADKPPTPEQRDDR